MVVYRLVVYADGVSRRVPALDAPGVAAEVGGRVERIAWDGRRTGPGGPYLSADLEATRVAPGLSNRGTPRPRYIPRTAPPF